jgi:translation initiation factor 1 (eIF-1/SUI1)
MLHRCFSSSQMLSADIVLMICLLSIQVIQLQGDQRKNVATFLVQAGIAKKENIKIHGF